jgi:ABC-type multidrug transport system ATPase subunit
VIEVDGVVKSLGERTVLDHVTFTAPAGTVTGLLGPNGAGKTTTMRLVATLLQPDEGAIRIDGIDVVTDPIEARRRIGLVTEEPGLLDRLTVREQLSYNGQAYGLSAADVDHRIRELADVLGFTDVLDRRAGVLSKGNRQKVSLCRALVHDPPVLLLDEPTSGLDVVAAAGLEDLLQRQELTGDRTVLLSTHRLDEVERLASRVVGIADGRVVVDATPDELVDGSGAESFRDAFVRVLGGARPDDGERVAG